MLMYPCVTTQLWSIESTGSSQSPSLSLEAIDLSTVPSFSTSSNFCLRTAIVYSNLKPGTYERSRWRHLLVKVQCMQSEKSGDQAEVDMCFEIPSRTRLVSRKSHVVALQHTQRLAALIPVSSFLTWPSAIVRFISNRTIRSGWSGRLTLANPLLCSPNLGYLMELGVSVSLQPIQRYTVNIIVTCCIINNKSN